MATLYIYCSIYRVVSVPYIDSLKYFKIRESITFSFFAVSQLNNDFLAVLLVKK